LADADKGLSSGGGGAMWNFLFNFDLLETRRAGDATESWTGKDQGGNTKEKASGHWGSGYRSDYAERKTHLLSLTKNLWKIAFEEVGSAETPFREKRRRSSQKERTSKKTQTLSVIKIITLTEGGEDP